MGRHDHVTPDDTLTEFLPVVADQAAAVPSVLTPLAQEELDPIPHEKTGLKNLDGGDIATIAIWAVLSGMTTVAATAVMTPMWSGATLGALVVISHLTLAWRLLIRETP